MARRSPRNRIERRPSGREPYDRVLIVCEGKRTEPFYIQGLRDHDRLHTANVKILGCGADPGTLVSEAKRLRDEEQSRNERYDRVYCVFDRDEHQTFDPACEKAKANGIEVIRSWPRFEFWLRLHFGFSRKPYTGSHGKSASEHCVNDVRKFLPRYEKASRTIFHELEPKLEYAMDNARKALIEAEKTGEYNPSTEMHVLVRYLRTLKQ